MNLDHVWDSTQPIIQPEIVFGSPFSNLSTQIQNKRPHLWIAGSIKSPSIV